MALEIISKKMSENRKRLDVDLVVSPFWGADYKLSLRILAREEIVEDKEEALLDEVVEQKKNWKEGKKNRYLYLKGISGTAYIINEEKVES